MSGENCRSALTASRRRVPVAFQPFRSRAAHIMQLRPIAARESADDSLHEYHDSHPPNSPLQLPLGRLLRAALDDCWEVVGREYGKFTIPKWDRMRRPGRAKAEPRVHRRARVRLAPIPLPLNPGCGQNHSLLLAILRDRPRFMQPTRARGMCRREANEFCACALYSKVLQIRYH
jgi:hypothetical protein